MPASDWRAQGADVLVVHHLVDQPRQDLVTVDTHSHESDTLPEIKSAAMYVKVDLSSGVVELAQPENFKQFHVAASRTGPR